MYHRLSQDVVTLSCKSRRFDYLLPVFIRRWGRLVTRHHLKHDGRLWLEHFDPHCSGKKLLPQRSIVVPLSCCVHRETQQESGTTPDPWGNNFSPEQWGSKYTNHSRPSWFKWCRVTSRPHRLMKTSVKQSKRRDIQLKVTTSLDKR